MMMIMVMIRGRDGLTYIILIIKEQETHQTLQEHDDDDDNDPRKRWSVQLYHEDQGTGKKLKP